MFGWLFKSKKKKIEESVESVVENVTAADDTSTEITADVVRQTRRKPTFAEAVLSTAYGSAKKGVVLDVSKKGAKVRFVSTDGMIEGAKMRLKIPRRNVSKIGRIAWKDQTDVGLDFIS